MTHTCWGCTAASPVDCSLFFTATRKGKFTYRYFLSSALAVQIAIQMAHLLGLHGSITSHSGNQGGQDGGACQSKGCKTHMLLR